MSLVGAQKRHKRKKSSEPRDAGGVHSPSTSSSGPSLLTIPIGLDSLSATLLSLQGSLCHLTSGQMTPSEIAASDTSKPHVALAVHVLFSTPVDLSSPTTGSFPHELEHARIPTLAHSKSLSFATTGDGLPQGRGSPISRITTPTGTQAALLGRASPLPTAHEVEDLPVVMSTGGISLGD